MTKPWFSDIPEGSPISAYWERRNAEQATMLESRVKSKLAAIEEAVESGIITKEIGDQRKGEFDKEERAKLTFFDPPSLGKRIEEKNPVFLRDAATGQQVFASGADLISKIVSGETRISSKAMAEFFAADLGVPVERLWQDTLKAEVPPEVQPTPPAAAPAAAPVTQPPPAPPPAASNPDDDLPPPGPVGGTPATTQPAATTPPQPETKTTGRGSRARAAATPPTQTTPPAAQPEQAAPVSNGTYPDLRVTNGTRHNILVHALARPDGSILIHLLPDNKVCAVKGAVHARHAVVRYQDSPEADRENDYETVELVVQPHAPVQPTK